MEHTLGEEVPCKFNINAKEYTVMQQISVNDLALVQLEFPDIFLAFFQERICFLRKLILSKLQAVRLNLDTENLLSISDAGKVIRDVSVASMQAARRDQRLVSMALHSKED